MRVGRQELRGQARIGTEVGERLVPLESKYMMAIEGKGKVELNIRCRYYC
jgi:hypothetical protein